MEIPKSFRPEKNLDDRVEEFLEGTMPTSFNHKSFDHVEVSVVKHLHDLRIKHISHTYRKVESKFTDDLRIIFDYGVGEVRVADFRIFESAFERHTYSYTVGDLKAKEYQHVVGMAEMLIREKEKGFDFNSLKENVKNDVELLRKLDDLFGRCPPGDLHLLVSRNSEVCQLMAPKYENFPFGNKLKSIYNEYVMGYLPSTH